MLVIPLIRDLVRRRPAVNVSRAITSVSVERIVSRTYAAAAFVFGAISVSPAFSGQREMDQVWAWIFGLGLFGGLAASAVAGLTGRRIRVGAGLVAVAYLLMVVSWPVAVANPGFVQPGAPWIWGLCNVAMAAAAVAFPDWIAGAYVLVVSVVWTVIRSTPSGGQPGAAVALQDSGYVFILGLAVAVVVGLLRRAATEVDAAHATATRKYARASQELENEKQRMAVDALLHDSVLTTFLQASRAETPAEKRLAARMAIKSLNVVADNEDALDRENRPITAEEIQARFALLKAEIDVPVTLVTVGPDEHLIPFAVAEALFGASLQALVNSAQHAGPTVTERSVRVEWNDTCVAVIVEDDGKGFDPSIDTGRLGVRLSIIERVEAVGGHVQIDSAPGHGARFTMTWEHPVATLATPLPAHENPRAATYG